MQVFISSAHHSFGVAPGVGPCDLNSISSRRPVPARVRRLHFDGHQSSGAKAVHLQQNLSCKVTRVCPHFGIALMWAVIEESSRFGASCGSVRRGLCQSTTLWFVWNTMPEPCACVSRTIACASGVNSADWQPSCSYGYASLQSTVSRIARLVVRAAGVVMARVIEFYVPQTFRSRVNSVSAGKGKVISFAAWTRKFAWGWW